MAHSLSAKKRVRQNIRRRAINRARRGKLRAQVKAFEKALENKDPKVAVEQFGLVVKRLDQVSASGTIHKRTAARKKSRLAKRLNALLAASSKQTQEKA